MIVTITLSLIFCIAAFYLFVYLSSYHPLDKQNEPVFSSPDAPLLNREHSIKIMTWNIQFMAGKGYHFWFESLDNSGQDERPDRKSITKTIQEVANIIKHEDPDIILLQEVDDGAKRSDYEDQLKRLLDLLPDKFSCHTSCFYWKTSFLPHPKIMGATGMKLSIISKYKIKRAIRHCLPLVPKNWIVQQLGIKRAVLKAQLPYAEGGELIIMNTHLEAFAQGYDTLQKQVEKTREMLKQLDEAKKPWIIGGDFNLLPPDQLAHLDCKSRQEYQPETELQSLYNQFQMAPSLQQLSDEKQSWLTYFANDPKISNADRTLDYLFYADCLQSKNAAVNQSGGFGCSDHAPLSAEFKLSSHGDFWIKNSQKNQ